MTGTRFHNYHHYSTKVHTHPTGKIKLKESKYNVLGALSDHPSFLNALKSLSLSFSICIKTVNAYNDAMYRYMVLSWPSREE